MAYTKIAGREKNPDFMRKHPHNKPESPVCGNCNNFEIEDINGNGFCDVRNGFRHCSCLACNQWQERQTAEERLAIHRVLQHANNPMVATDKWADEMIKEAVEKLGKCPGEIMGTDILILEYEPKNIL